jgi:hypothetical protein
MRAPAAGVCPPPPNFTANSACIRASLLERGLTHFAIRQFLEKCGYNHPLRPEVIDQSFSLSSGTPTLGGVWRLKLKLATLSRRRRNASCREASE